MLARTWTGWEVRWAGDGLGDLLAHLGLGRDFLREPCSTEVGEPGWLRPDDEDIVTLLTARGPNGEIRAWGSYWHVVEQLHGGRGLLDLLPLDAPAPVLEGMPEGGIHLDTGSRTLGVWTTAIAIGLHEWPLPGWDGWSLEFWGEDHTRQAAQAGDRVRFPRTDLTPALTAWLGRVGDPPADPAVLLSLAATPPPGSDLTAVVNPSATVRHQSSEPTVAEHAALRAAVAALLAERQPFGIGEGV